VKKRLKIFLPVSLEGTVADGPGATLTILWALLLTGFCGTKSHTVPFRAVIGGRTFPGTIGCKFGPA